MESTTKANGVTLTIGNVQVTITPANGAVPTKRAYRRRRATATGEAKRPVGRPRKVVQAQEA